MTDRTQKAYAEQFPRETVERPIKLAKTLWPCCGEHREGPHHEACARYVTDPTPTHVDGQESLL